MRFGYLALQISTLTMRNQLVLSLCLFVLYCTPAKDPAAPQSSTPYSSAAQPRQKLIWGPWTVLWKTAVLNLFQLSFFYLMNEISHAALLQALAHLGGRALSLSLFVSFFKCLPTPYCCSSITDTHFGNKHPIN